MESEAAKENEEKMEMMMTDSGKPSGVVIKTEGTVDPVALIKKRIAIIKTVMKDCMKEGIDYGVIPGCGKKPALLKPGAEKLIVTFRFAPKLRIAKEWIEVDGLRHLNVDVDVDMLGPKGEFMGEGTGSCSTLESKYRYRSGHTVIDEPIPKDYKEKKAEYREKGLGCKKDDDGNWLWVKFEGKEINKDLADVYNTVKKMAKKRALVDATLTVSGVSDLFTQDIEEQGKHESKGADNVPQKGQRAQTQWRLTKDKVPGDYWKNKDKYPGLGTYPGDDGTWYFKEKIEGGE